MLFNPYRYYPGYYYRRPIGYGVYPGGGYPFNPYFRYPNPYYRRPFYGFY